MSGIVHVNLGDRSYDIHIGSGLPIGSVLSPDANPSGLIVADTNTDPLFGDASEAVLREDGFRVERVVVPAGETSKDQGTLGVLYDKALEMRLERSSFVVALGGGVVGDLSGYFAATYLRGIRFVQVPTTIVSMVDSSVGGKTGINLPGGKNLVGAFYQPVEVVADLDRLTPLPEREYRSGLAEVVKYGVIRDAEFFDSLEGNVEALLARDFEYLAFVIGRSCQIKADVVATDELDTGLRALLNFGHTLGHALEGISGYGRWSHGEAVAIGMVYAARLSVLETGLPELDCERLIALLQRLGLPTEASDCPWEALRDKMAVDKKVVGGKPLFVLAEAIGSARHGCEVADAVLAETWAESARSGVG